MTRFVRIAFIIISFCSVRALSFAQTENDVYLFTVEKSGKGEYHLHSPKFLSGFNKGGYTNQPSFTHMGDLLVSVRKPGETQNDIYLLLPTLKKYRKLTKTNASEYSPRIHPDEEHLTVLRQIQGDSIDQRICNIHLKSGEMKCVTGNAKDIGYYTWLNPKELALFRIDGEMHRLSIYNVEDNKNRRVTSGIGRTLLSDKSGQIIYIHKYNDEYWYLKKYNPANSNIEVVTQTVTKNEDFVIATDGTIFMGKDHLLYAYHPDYGKEWKEVADLSVYGIKYISRMAISPDSKKIVVVATKTKS